LARVGPFATRVEFDADLRRRLTVITLLPAERMRDLGFFSWNDRMLDAATLRSSDPALRDIFGQACIDAFRHRRRAAAAGKPVLDLGSWGAFSSTSRATPSLASKHAGLEVAVEAT